MTVLNCHACGSLPYVDRGKFGWLCQACWERVCRVLGREA